MTDIKVGPVDGNFKHIDSTPPEGVTPPSNVMTLEATIENKPQPLRTLRPFSAACLKIPGSLRAEAHIVLQALFSCFEKQKVVREGLIGDLIFGFSVAGIKPELSVVGLRELEKSGYIRFQAPDNEYVHIDDDKATAAWVRYQSSLLVMVYDDPTNA